MIEPKKEMESILEEGSAEESVTVFEDATTEEEPSADIPVSSNPSSSPSSSEEETAEEERETHWEEITDKEKISVMEKKATKKSIDAEATTEDGRKNGNEKEIEKGAEPAGYLAAVTQALSGVPEESTSMNDEASHNSKKDISGKEGPPSKPNDEVIPDETSTASGETEETFETKEETVETLSTFATSTQERAGELDFWMDSFLSIQGITCCGYGRAATLEEKRAALFQSTDRLALADEQVREYEVPQDVLELALTEKHLAGGHFSNKYAVVIEIPQRHVRIRKIFPPKRGLQLFQEGIRDLINFLTLNLEPILEKNRDRWETADPQTFEMILNKCGPIRSQAISNDIAIFVRHASIEEVTPYPVELHLSQKSWYQRMLTSSAQKSEQWYKEDAMKYHPPLKNIEFPIPGNMILPIDLADTFMGRVYQSPKEVAALCTKRQTSSRNGQRLQSTSNLKANLWIPDHDVVLGNHENNATTAATLIFQERVLPVYASKSKLRDSHIMIMTLMLKEELEDTGIFQSKNVPISSFWLKLADADDEQRRDMQAKDAKWLRKANGDFIGPFVQASKRVLKTEIARWLKDPKAMASMQPREPEANLGITKKIKQNALDVVYAKKHSMDSTVKSSKSSVFNLSGPIDTLDEEAKQTCQKWVDDSESLLVKAAKKAVVDSFQADFHSFLFLFQLQLQRIREGNHGLGDAGSVSSADDKSWVSAEPSVDEESSRVAEIERACVAFMNQMGNDMVRHYERLAADHLSENKPAVEERDDQFVTQEASRCNEGREESPVGVWQVDDFHQQQDRVSYCSSGDPVHNLERVNSKASRHSHQSRQSRQSRYSRNSIKSRRSVLSAPAPSSNYIDFEVEEREATQSLLGRPRKSRHSQGRRHKDKKQYNDTRSKNKYDDESTMISQSDYESDSYFSDASFDPSFDDTYAPSYEHMEDTDDYTDYSYDVTLSRSDGSYEEFADKSKNKSTSSWVDSLVPSWLA